MSLELVSFDLCPFVQRSVITLLHKSVEHEITYIDLADPPPWFNAISPLGKVPLLKVDGEVLFESAVINEFIDETTGKPIMPQDDALLRARNRAWIEFASNLVGTQYRLTTAEDKEGFERERKAYCESLTILEKQLSAAGPYFNGDKFSLVDTAYAPGFMRERILERFNPIMREADFPKYRLWGDALLALAEVKDSVVSDFSERYLSYFNKINSFALKSSALKN